MDGNRQIYPIAFGVAATESDETWSWFFQQLRKVVGHREDLVFISDRHPSIEKCCLGVFPGAVYGICMFHFGLNVAARYKVKPEEFLYTTANAYTEFDFEESMHRLRSTKKNVYDYLMDVDLKK
ncbi:hypothetical protein LIER_32578 [Lithospermum erythrorhizon]|uniref:MULE transposase domain-containing protein n=1 Tax=Lithospermum erythrorhizon TaxID=34254 RepID=A0AAV3RWR0_LITER